MLVGLSRAPDLVPAGQGMVECNGLRADQLGAVVVPQGALGGEALLAAVARDVPVIAVANPSLLAVTPELLGMADAVLPAASYSEAAGLVLALREGLSPASLQRPLPRLA